MGIATAGHDTTSSSIVGGIWALAENPAEFAKAQKDLALIPDLVNEAFRWTKPILHFMRSAAMDTELRGRKIARGD
jgi:cytochrome P450